MPLANALPLLVQATVSGIVMIRCYGEFCSSISAQVVVRVSSSLVRLSTFTYQLSYVLFRCQLFLIPNSHNSPPLCYFVCVPSTVESKQMDPSLFPRPSSLSISRWSLASSFIYQRSAPLLSSYLLPLWTRLTNMILTLQWCLSLVAVVPAFI